MKKLITLVGMLFFYLTAVGQNNQDETFGIRGGLGTDISGGLAYGLGFNYRLQPSMEMGLVIFGGKSTETSDNGFNTYVETTKVFVLGAQANWLFNHYPDQAKLFFIAGTGLAFINADWEERSDTDTSLGTPLPNGGSMQSESGSTGGVIFDIGLGHTFKSPFDLRFEVPIIVPFGYENIGVIPTFIFTAGYRFAKK
ncbi:MAG: hypothetical protein KDC79_15610 [Cyclobacteriaceae bacterium]|nr:hypothetical protein [Cyclobacteriaceae bacterium]